MAPKRAASKAKLASPAKAKASPALKKAASKDSLGSPAVKRSASAASLGSPGPALKRAKSFKKGGARPKLDEKYVNKSGQVFGDADGTWWDCMLNQTNVDANNNKFFVIQVIEVSGKYDCWTRWGRVGEPGQNQNQSGLSLDAAKKAFDKKFHDKTKNKWADRLNFKPAAGKYTLIEMDHAGDEEVAAEDPKGGGPAAAGPSKPCTLEKRLQATVQLIFNHDMFKEGLKELGLDVDKMPLGKLSKTQVDKGTKILEDLEKALEHGKSKEYGTLTSQYYTTVPHNFGRTKPPVIATKEQLQKEFTMLNALNDIVIGVQASKNTVKTASNVDDENYNALNTTLRALDPKSPEFQFIDTYTKETQGNRKCKVLEVFDCNRSGEGDKFKSSAKLQNRKLLWHGTSVPVVVAILKSGLRIMPHAGGRVGRGLYFASENGKSAGYVGTTGDSSRWGSSAGVGYMFLVEVALGKENGITRDNSSLKKAPEGFDCVVARGRTEPDATKDKSMMIEGNRVYFAQGKPKATEFADSSFQQSEYLVYNENQARIRYMLKMQF